MAEDDRKTFTSQKLDLMNALVADIELTMSDRVVALRLLAHADSSTWEIFPSQVRIALEIGLKQRAVKYCIKRLAETGWLVAERTNRRLSNRYRFSFDRVGQITDRLNLIRDELAALRGTALPIKKTVEGQNGAPERGSKMPLVRGTALPPNTLRLSPEVTPTSAGAEDEVPSLGAEVSFDGEPAGAVAPHNASKPAGGSQAPAPSSSLLNSKAFREARNGHVTVDPFTSLDRLEADIKAGRFRR